MMEAFVSHPRLFIGSREIEKARANFSIPLLVRALEQASLEAENFSKSGIFEYPQNTQKKTLGFYFR